MEAVVPNVQVAETIETRQQVISIELLAYIALIVLSLVLRIAEIDAIPLNQDEAREALASWRGLHPNLPGTDIVAQSPMQFFFQNITFTVLGGSEMSARIMTVIGGMLLAMTPLLFRAYLGRARTFWLILFLTFSPVLLLASRFSSAAIWSLLFSVVGLWGIWRYWETQHESYGVLATALFISTVFLTDSGGIVLMLILFAAGAIALWLSALDAPDKLDIPGNEFLVSVRARFAAWPMQQGLLMGALAVIVVGTTFMLNASGLSTVGELLSAALRGVSTHLPDTPGAFPLAVSVFYEPFVWGFAIAAVVLLYRRGVLNFFERLLIAWVALAFILSIFYAGAGPDHALWLTVPLAALASYTATSLFTYDENALVWGSSDGEFAPLEMPWWSKWLLAAAIMALLAVFAVHLQAAGRSLVTFPSTSTFTETINLLLEPRYVVLLRSLIWVLLSVVFVFVGYLLAASVWGNMTSAQGGALGILLFGLITSAGSGWNAAVRNADNPVELWHTEASSSEVFLLRETLFDFAMRETGGFLDVPITVVRDEEKVLTDDGVLAWILRDFEKVRYVESVESARGREIVLIRLPSSDGELPDLGGSYVGQSFELTSIWDSTTHLLDIPGWWSQRTARNEPRPLKTLILWARQDVYDGVSPITEAAG